MNLIDLIQGSLTGSAVSKMASVLGENTDRTRAGINAAIPSILSELDNVASTPDGARRLNSAIDDADDSLLSNLGGFFSKAASGSTGLGVLSSILGTGGLSRLNGGLGKTTGLSGPALSSLLGLLAPVIFGVLRRALSSGTSGFSDIASLLASQRANIASAIPAGTRTGRYEEEVYTPPPTETIPRTEHKRSNLGWIVPLALFGGALALLWQLARPSTNVRAGRERTEMSTTQRTTVDDTRLLDTLKAKYHSVLEEARNQGVHITQLHQQNGKLVLKGTAPTQEAANRVWNEIKRVNPKMDDIIADISISSAAMPSQSLGRDVMDSAASAGKRAVDATENVFRERAEPLAAVADTYTVQRGDTLRSISRHFYGDEKDYSRILDANRAQISNENLIRVGQELAIPGR